MRVAEHLAEFRQNGVRSERIVGHSNTCLSIHLFVISKVRLVRRGEVVTAELWSINPAYCNSLLLEIN